MGFLLYVTSDFSFVAFIALSLFVYLLLSYFML